MEVTKNSMARAHLLRVFFIFGEKAGPRDARCHGGVQQAAPLQRERKDLEIAFAGEDDG
jgi:hypothetical protein